MSLFIYKNLIEIIKIIYIIFLLYNIPKFMNFFLLLINFNNLIKIQ